MNILGPPSEDYDTVVRLIGARGTDLFIDHMVPALWEEATRYGVDPVGVVAQSAHETGWGAFKGVVPPTFHNTAGIKIMPAIQLAYFDIAGGDRPFAHAQFGNWNHGARAQVHHLRAYASAPVPEDEVVHARYYDVLRLQKHIITFQQLSNNWAGAGYGDKVMSIARTLVEIGQ